MVGCDWLGVAVCGTLAAATVLNTWLWWRTERAADRAEAVEHRIAASLGKLLGSIRRLNQLGGPK